MRIVWVDYYKAIAIFLIVLGHAVLNCSDLVDFLFLFHVPAFFFISGYLEKTDKCKSKDYVLKVVFSLVVPYYVWNLLFLLFHLPFSFHNLLLMLCGVTRWNGASWFLIVLVIIKMNALLYKNKRYVLGAMMTLVLFALNLYGRHLPYLIDVSFLFLPFFFAGMYGKSLIHKLLLMIEDKKILTISLAAISLCLLVLFFQYSPIVHTHTIIDFSSQFYLFWISGFIGIFSLLWFAYIFCNSPNKSVVVISTGTMFVMCSHYEVVKPLTGYLSYNYGDLVALFFVLLYFFIQCLCVPFVLKWIPVLAGRKKCCHKVCRGSRQ